jgi:hypothetical protein
MKSLIAAFLLAPAAALATPPDACSLLTLDEVNAIAERKAERAVTQQSGNPSKCSFVDARKAAVLVITVREVQYAVRDEMYYERENLEKIYRARSKALDTIGEGGYWLGANKQLTFRKGKVIASVNFATTKNQNEVDSGQVARLVESRLPK